MTREQIAIAIVRWLVAFIKRRQRTRAIEQELEAHRKTIDPASGIEHRTLHFPPF
tara:strand:- start:35609 stop:35773 length:165 start_codon:yes stop_codon:yes gene_type:complete